MSTVTDNDLRGLKDLINSKFEAISKDLTDIKVEIATLKEGQNSLNTRLNETKEAINKRLDSVDNRLNTVTLGVFGLIGVLVTALLTFLGKLIFFPNI